MRSLATFHLPYRYDHVAQTHAAKEPSSVSRTLRNPKGPFEEYITFCSTVVTATS
jgi:hypothetical protein